MKCSNECKQAVLAKRCPAHKRLIREGVAEEGVSEAPSVRIVVASFRIVSKRGRTGADSEVFQRTQAMSTGQTLPTAQPLDPCEVAAEEGISEATLYNWRKQGRARG